MNVPLRLAVPRGPAGKVLAVIWLGACLALLVFGFVQRQIHDMAEAFIWILLVLTFPLGAAAAVVVGVAMGALTMALGTRYHPFWDEIPIWCVGVLVGYWQWFVLVPEQLRSKGRKAGDRS